MDTFLSLLGLALVLGLIIGVVVGLFVAAYQIALRSKERTGKAAASEPVPAGHGH
jgi:uncharacterized protein YneF (UPF0154 family)